MTEASQALIGRRSLRALDQILQHQRQPLQGVAIAIKDVINTRDMPTQGPCDGITQQCIHRCSPAWSDPRQGPENHLGRLARRNYGGVGTLGLVMRGEAFRAWGDYYHACEICERQDDGVDFQDKEYIGNQSKAPMQSQPS
jgi:hypothetical protein